MRDRLADRLLEEYLSATADADIEESLTRILQDIARPVTRAIATSILGRSDIDCAEDVTSETILHLVRRLRSLKADPSQSIQDLRGYIATAAYNRCHELLRERYPARTRLRNHLQYLLNHDARLALWRDAQSRPICGRQEWVGHSASGGRRADDLRLQAGSDPAAEDRRQIGRLVIAILDAIGSPIELDQLVETIACTIGIEKRAEISLDDVHVERAPVVESNFEWRLSLRDLWQDIQQIPLKQRMALLLNLRDAHGREILSLLPHTGMATIAEIGDLLQIPTADFKLLWNQLPLPDKVIARLLDATPKQVIKLRRLARERLRRQLRRRETAGALRTDQKVELESRSSLPGGAKSGTGSRQ